jgi:hypothetical protein
LRAAWAARAIYSITLLLRAKIFTPKISTPRLGGRKEMKSEGIIALVLLALAIGFLIFVEPGSRWLFHAITGH